MTASGWVSKFVPTRTIVLAIAIWMTWRVTEWAMGFAAGTSRGGMDLGAIIAAVTGPASAFGGYVFKAYLDSKNDS